MEYVNVKFTEAKLEQTIIDILGSQGYPHVKGESIPRTIDQVLIKEDLKPFLSKRYKKDKITETEIEAIIRKLESFSAVDLYESNNAFMKMVSDGFTFKRDSLTPTLSLGEREKDIRVCIGSFKGQIQANWGF